MSIYADLLIDRIGQLCVMPTHQDGPQRGALFGTLGLIPEAAVAVRNGRIILVGSRESVIQAVDAGAVLDAAGRLVTPGLIDPHTHIIWAGDRAVDFEAARGQLIDPLTSLYRTVRETRYTSFVELVEQATTRLDRMLSHGTTTVEVKTGYGLDLHTEITLLNTLTLIDSEHPIDLVPTFLGAAAIPLEYQNDPEEYVDLVCQRIIPAALTWRNENWTGTLFCDVVCDEGAFNRDQTERILRAARALGLPLKLHTDARQSLGAIRLAVNLNAQTVDDLTVITPEDVAILGKSDTAAVILPTHSFGRLNPRIPPVQALLDSGVILALGTDCNPDTGWCESMQLVLALATRTYGLTPAQALAACTVNAAYAVGRSDQIGSLEVGKNADIIVWETNDYRQLGYRFGGNLVHSVVKAGQVVANAGGRLRDTNKTPLTISD